MRDAAYARYGNYSGNSKLSDPIFYPASPTGRVLEKADSIHILSSFAIINKKGLVSFLL